MVFRGTTVGRTVLCCAAILVLLAAAGRARAEEADTIPPLSEASLRTQKWFHEHMVDAYEKVGKHDPKWDELARRAVRICADLQGASRGRGPTDEQAYEAARQAVELGCDDPMVVYTYARTFANFGSDPEKCVALHKRAADLLMASHYSAYFKAHSAFRATGMQVWIAREHGRAAGRKKVDEAEWKECDARLRQGSDVLRELAKEGEKSTARWIELGDVAIAAFDFNGQRAELFKFVIPSFLKYAPKAAARTTQATLFISWAWEARGGGFADTVTPEGWQTMANRLNLAQVELEEAWKLDPTCASIPARMINVELGQGQGRDRMELWFKRAMDLDPDSSEACGYKLYYLEPRWYGTDKDVLDFGRECLRGGRFNSNVPMVLLNAHDALSHYTHGGYQIDSDPAYFKNPVVWADLKPVLEGFLRADRGMDCTHYQNLYARTACLCEAWDDANRMFATVGDKVDIRIWSREEFDAARKAASARARP